jgi:uncharacterized protein (TIGR02284 family)
VRQRCRVTMSTSTSILNDLIETARDGQEGFRVAAEDVDSPELKNLFMQYSAERGSFVADLQSFAKGEGDSSPEDSGSLAGTLHRGWINLKSVLATRNTHGVLAECERGEDSAVEEYRKAIASPDLTGDVRSVVERQYTRVKAAHDRVKELRDSYAPKS